MRSKSRIILVTICRAIAVILFGVLFLPLLFLHAQEPARISVSQLMAECRKDYLSRDVAVRRRAVDGFHSFSSQVLDLAHCLNMALSDQDEHVRIKAAKALAKMGPSARSAMDNLVEMLEKDKVVDARLAAASALGAIHQKCLFDDYEKKAVYALTKAMRRDPDPNVRHTACTAFRLIGRGAKDGAADLVELIKECRDPTMREVASISLGSVVGPDTKGIVPTLLAMYKNEPDEISFEKAIWLEALGRIGDQENVIVPLMIEALKDDKKKGFRGSAAAGIGHLGPKAKAAIPALIKALDVSVYPEPTEGYAVRSAVLDALGSMGSEAATAIPAIRRIAETDRLCQFRAQRALQAIEQKK